MKRLLFGCRTALIVCHAIIIAITVVLPAPVAILSAIRDSPGLASEFTSSMWSKDCVCRLPRSEAPPRSAR